MASVKNCLNRKKGLVYSLPSSSSVYSALELMRANRIRSVLVIDDGRLQGIVTQGDCAIKVLLAERSPRQTPLADIMTRNPLTVGSAAPLDRCLKLLMSRRIRHLPVVDNDHVAGVISIGDCVQYLMQQQDQHIRQLETMVRGHDPEEPDLG
jgi:CBS domain-containing protein